MRARDRARGRHDASTSPATPASSATWQLIGRHLRARRRGAADRRPLHDGPARGRGRARAARRRSAACPCHCGTFPLLTGTPEELRELAPRRRGRRARAGGHGRRCEGALVRRDGPAGAGDRGRGRARRRGGARARRRRRRRARCARRTSAARPSSCAPTTAEEVDGGARAARGRLPSLVPADERELLELDLRGADLWLVAPSSRPTRSSPATSTPGSGASRRSRSSSPSARSCRGPSRTSARSRRRRTRTRATGPTGCAAPRRASARGGRRALTAADDGREQRQLGVVDAQGGAATFTGAECLDWAGGRTGAGYAAQGNILVSRRDGRRARRDVRGDRRARRSPSGCSTASPRRRRRAATAAASSRRRCSSSSRTAATPASPTSLVDLRVDDHERPIEELRRLYGMHQLALRDDAARGVARRRRRRSRAELRERLARLGYEGELEHAFATGPAPRTSRSASTASTRIDPGRARGAAGEQT